MSVMLDKASWDFLKGMKMLIELWRQPTNHLSLHPELRCCCTNKLRQNIKLSYSQLWLKWLSHFNFFHQDYLCFCLETETKVICMYFNTFIAIWFLKPAILEKRSFYLSYHFKKGVSGGERLKAADWEPRSEGVSSILDHARNFPTPDCKKKSTRHHKGC